MKFSQKMYSKFPKFTRSLRRSYSEGEDEVCGEVLDSEEEVVLEPGDKLTTEDGEEIVVTEAYSRNRIRYSRSRTRRYSRSRRRRGF